MDISSQISPCSDVQSHTQQRAHKFVRGKYAKYRRGVQKSLNESLSLPRRLPRLQLLLLRLLLMLFVRVQKGWKEAGLAIKHLCKSVQNRFAYS